VGGWLGIEVSRYLELEDYAWIFFGAGFILGFIPYYLWTTKLFPTRMKQYEDDLKRSIEEKEKKN
jgi:hypothetical protein